jgi:hypothetical protein
MACSIALTPPAPLTVCGTLVLSVTSPCQLLSRMPSDCLVCALHGLGLLVQEIDGGQPPKEYYVHHKHHPGETLVYWAHLEGSLT